jgi:sterol desaturase/sphingolipid hydroxylase (fatty acid hydroxylase superfamily)
VAELVRLLDLRTLLVLAIVFIPLERLLAWRPHQPVFRRLWATDLVYQVFNKVIINLLLLGLIVAAAELGRSIVPAAWQAAVARQSLWLQVPAATILADVGVYLVHRAFHTVPWLWQFHAVHHSIEEMDWMVAARVHPVDQVATKGLSLVPLYVVGFSAGAIGIFATIYVWQAVLIHSNVRLRFGPLRWLVASPEFHHWHHSSNPHAYNRNFAAQLPLIDLIFGTLYLPRGRSPERYGVVDPVPQTYLGQLVYPFRAIARLARRSGRAASREAV